jgi:hypothetical protein
MKPGSDLLWLLLRIVLISSNITAVLQITSSPVAGFGWFACALVSIVSGMLVFAWLFVAKSRSRVDLSHPYTLTGAFFPMGRYPLRFWFTVSLMLMPSAAVASVIELISHQRLLPIDATFLLWGLFTLCAVIAHVRFLRSRRGLSRLF